MRPGGSRRNDRRPVSTTSSKAAGSSASGNRQASPTTAREGDAVLRVAQGAAVASGMARPRGGSDRGGSDRGGSDRGDSGDSRDEIWLINTALSIIRRPA